MKPWLRVLGLLAAAAVAALLLRVLPPLLVLGVLLCGLAVASRLLRERPRREVGKASAEILGLQAAPSDHVGVVAYPLSLFERGSEGRSTDLAFGRWGGLDVTVFDYGYVSSVSPDGGPAERVFTCALAPAPVGCAHLVAEPEAFLTATEDRPRLEGVRIGVEPFDRAFDVRSDDPEFATSFLDGGLATWLLAQEERWGLEVDERIAMVYAPRLAPSDRPEVLRALRGVMDRIPAPAVPPPAQAPADPPG
jgi:hypothetical protein